MEMKVSGILDKIEGKSELIGGAFGFMNDIIRNPPETWAETMMYRISKWHIPNPMHTFSQMQNNPGYPVMEYAMGAIGGWIIQQAGPVVDSRLGQLGRIVKKMSVSALIGNIVSAFIWLPAFNPGGEAGWGTSPIAGTGTSPRGTVYGVPTNSPQWSGAVGGPNTPHTSGADGFRSQLSWERVGY